jgi:predicted choloylglycine hydrolase
VDDYPLYIGRYIGDYRFDEYRISGSWPRLAEIGCTCFINRLVFGRNFDFPANPALLLWTYPDDGYKSVSMVDLGYFGYSMVNQPSEPRGLEFIAYLPFDGMNEKGLVVGMAAIPYAEPPSSTGKVSIGEIEVIRLLLDYASNVEEAIELIEDYNVVMTEPPIHYLIADAYGNSVIIEFLDTKMELYKSNESQIITNFLVSQVNLPDGSPCMRYNAVYAGIENNVDMSVEGAFNLLEASAQSSTIWSVVYDIQNLTIHVVMGGKYTQIHSFEFLDTE